MWHLTGIKKIKMKEWTQKVNHLNESVEQWSWETKVSQRLWMSRFHFPFVVRVTVKLDPVQVCNLAGCLLAWDLLPLSFIDRGSSCSKNKHCSKEIFYVENKAIKKNNAIKFCNLTYMELRCHLLSFTPISTIVHDMSQLNSQNSLSFWTKLCNFWHSQRNQFLKKINSMNTWRSKTVELIKFLEKY